MCNVVTRRFERRAPNNREGRSRSAARAKYLSQTHASAHSKHTEHNTLQYITCPSDNQRTHDLWNPISASLRAIVDRARARALCCPRSCCFFSPSSSLHFTIGYTRPRHKHTSTTTTSLGRIVMRSRTETRESRAGAR